MIEGLRSDMFTIYLYEGKEIKGSSGERLIVEAAKAFCREHQISTEEDTSFQILRSPEGKPYFPNLPVQFNVSHSGLMWICMMGLTPCGIDIQEVKNCAYKKMAARYFSRYEQSFVLKGGIESFFDLWVRREALGKYTGRGFFDPSIPSFVDGNGLLIKSAMIGGKQVYIRELEFTPDIKCAYCSEEEEDEIQIFGG